MTDYKKLVKALRCKSLSKQCDSCKYGYRLCPDSECNDACHVERIIDDAAATIEALQAEVESMDESCKKQLVAMASHVAELQAAQPHWVSVFKEDALPEPPQEVQE